MIETTVDFRAYMKKEAEKGDVPGWMVLALLRDYEALRARYAL